MPSRRRWKGTRSANGYAAQNSFRLSSTIDPPCMRRNWKSLGCIASRNTIKIPLKPGNANLLIGVLRHANQEIGVPRGLPLHDTSDGMFVVSNAGKAYDSRDPSKSGIPVPKGLCHEERR